MEIFPESDKNGNNMKKMICSVLISCITSLCLFGQQGKIAIIDTTSESRGLFECIETSIGSRSNVIGKILITNNDTLIRFDTWLNGLNETTLINADHSPQKRKHCFYFVMRNCNDWGFYNSYTELSFAVSDNSISIIHDSCELDSLNDFSIQSILPDSEVVYILNVLNYLRNGKQ